jgi:hypothetical protein
MSFDWALDPDFPYYLTKLYAQWRRYTSEAAMLYKHFMWSLHVISKKCIQISLNFTILF